MNNLDRQLALRAALLVPCETKADLHRWIKVYLGLNIPDGHIDPVSNSSPMEMIWEVYSRMLNWDESLSRMLAYAARESFKTLGAAVLEILVILHMERDVGHMAAIDYQAKNAQRYVKGFCKRPFIRDFVTLDNERTIEFTRYKTKDGIALSPIEYAHLPDQERLQYEERSSRITILVATLNQTNSLHVPFFVQDELDLAPRAPLEEAKMIPTQGHSGEPSVTLMISTRKFSTGPVQDEIDKADESGLQLRHWNIIDVTRPCPVDRHLPDRPKIKIWVNPDILRAVSDTDYGLLSQEDKAGFVQEEGFEGCLSRCKLYSVCRGRLATDQKSKSLLNKRITETQSKFTAVDPDYAKAQLMCWMPSLEGMIYPRLNVTTHVLTPSQMATKLTGDNYPALYSKAELIQLMNSRGMPFSSGMDHGFTHAFAVVTGAVDANRMFVVDAIFGQEWELSQKIDNTKERFGSLGINPVIYADPEDAGSNKTLSRYFSLRKWDKGPGSVIEGIQIVRLKLTPTLKQEPELYFLKDDTTDLLIRQLRKYHWKLDPDERPTKDPDKVDDDLCDALRYLVMNVFGKRSGLVVAPGILQTPQRPVNAPPTQQNWMAQEIQRLTGDSEQTSTNGGIKVQKGNFYFGY